jgi:hypothetical protein
MQEQHGGFNRVPPFACGLKKGHNTVFMYPNPHSRLFIMPCREHGHQTHGVLTGRNARSQACGDPVTGFPGRLVKNMS